MDGHAESSAAPPVEGRGSGNDEHVVKEPPDQDLAIRSTTLSGLPRDSSSSDPHASSSVIKRTSTRSWTSLTQSTTDAQRQVVQIAADLQRQAAQLAAEVQRQATFSAQLAAEVRTSFSLKMLEWEKALRDAPVMALLTQADEPVALPDCVQIVAKAIVAYHASPRELHLVHLRPSLAQGLLPAQQILVMGAMLEDFAQESCADDGPWLWPVHCREVCTAIVVRNVLVRGLSTGRLEELCPVPEEDVEGANAQTEQPAWCRSPQVATSPSKRDAPVPHEGPSLRQTYTPCTRREMARNWTKRCITWLCIHPPQEDGPLLRAIRQHYGGSVTFSLSWSGFYAQHLWILAAIALVTYLLGTYPVGGQIQDEQRIKFEIAKALVVLWGATLVASSTMRFRIIDPLYTKLVWKMMMRPSKNNVKLPVPDRCLRLLKLVFLGVPALVMFFLVVFGLLVMHTQLILQVIYIWGDCINLDTPERPCRDPQLKHGFFLGWIVEVCCDVALAILFELIYALGELLARWIASLRDFEYRSDHNLFVKKLTIALALLDRIGFVFILAFLFVPQWLPHKESDCSDFTDFACLAQRLPIDRRRWLFQKLLRGPFLVAPFVALAMTTVTPWVAQLLHRLSHMPRYRIPTPLRILTRILSLIFSYDLSSTGFYWFLRHGGPFSDLIIVDNKDDKAERATLLEMALQQVLQRPFEPYDELLSALLSFVWVLFFAPIMPTGVFTTLFAGIVRLGFVIDKLLYVRRRPFPEEDLVMHQITRVFTSVAVFASIGWTIALSYITYNDDLQTYDERTKLLMFSGILAWLMLSVALLFLCRWPSIRPTNKPEGTPRHIQRAEPTFEVELSI